MIPSLPRLAHSAYLFKRAQTGLFAGKMKQFGNNVPHSMQKTRRTWLPNIQPKRLFSEKLSRFVEVKVTARALRTVDKYGGLDNYLLMSKDTALGAKGMRLRMEIKQKLEEVELAPTSVQVS